MGRNPNIFYVKQGDTEPTLVAQLRWQDGTPIDLTDVTEVRLHMALNYQLHVDQPVTIITPSEGRVSYGWTPGDTDVPGQFDAEFEVTFADGEIITCPNDGHFPIHVTRQVG